MKPLRFCNLLLPAILSVSWLSLPHPPVGAADGELFSAYDGAKNTDQRWQPLITLNGHFPFQVPEDLDAWEARSVALKRQILVAGGLYPLPEKTPLNPVIHGKVERDGFTVEKVFFESVPGNFVTGLLFRPAGESREKRPAVLCPHGHGGRFQDKGAEGVRREIAAGFERFEGSGRFPAMTRCAQLARMGCVTFIYDMIGYGDNLQIPFNVSHRQADRRPHMEGDDAWGFYSPQAEGRLQSIMGLQIWNSIRSLDFLSELPDVDPNRIAVTGNSGGGTQTLLLCAIDDRPIAAFPNGMVSTSMQGGCYCENASLLRVGTGNVELTALFAPKPLGMTSVDDWTRDMMTDGYPELKQLYRMYGREDSVMCKAYPHFPHNYNHVTRCLMYSFMNRHLGLGIAEPILEQDYPILTPEEYHVWNESHPQPEDGEAFETSLLKSMAEDSDAQLESMFQQDLPGYLKTIRNAYQTIVGRSVPKTDEVRFQQTGTASIAGTSIDRGIIELTDAGEQVPALWLHNGKSESPNRIVIMLNGSRKSSLFESSGRPISAVSKILDNDECVVGIDLFGAGENLIEGAEADTQRRVNDARQYSGFTYGYNPVRFVRQVHDVLTTIAAANQRYPDTPIDLVATQNAAPVAAVARLIATEKISRASLDTDGFRFSNLNSVWDSRFVPGAVKYGDFPAILAAQAPLPLAISGEKTAIPLVVDAYEKSSASDLIQWLKPQ